MSVGPKRIKWSRIMYQKCKIKSWEFQGSAVFDAFED